MEQERKDILDRNETEKMCSLVGNEAGEMCSPADTDTCGNSMPSVEKSPINQRISPFWE